MTLLHMGQNSKKASRELALASSENKNLALNEIINEITLHQNDVLQINLEEIENAKKAGLSPSLVDRLSLQGRLEGILNDIKSIIHLPDPVGQIIDKRDLPNLLHLERWRVPLGVLGVIYESRPNVTLDVSALALKSGNTAILRGGSETLRTNQCLVELIQRGLKKADLPPESIQLVQSTDRSLVKEMLHLHKYIDLIIPRGGASLHEFCRENSSIPVMTGGIGICHLYIDKSADFANTIEVVVNAKTQRPTVCNALDTLLVNSSIAEDFIPTVYKALFAKGVKFKLDSRAWEILKNSPECSLAIESDWDTEWLSLIIGIKVVDNLEEAIKHIQLHSTGHSDGIMTETKAHADKFLHEVDSAAVYWNASTRFTDGSQFGLGAEVAISTQKLHARGPLGLEELTSYKWIVKGNYHVRK